MTTSCNVHAKTGCGHDHGGHLPAAPGWHSLRLSSHVQRRRREGPQEAGPQDWCLSAWLCKKATARLKRVQRNQTRKTTGGFRTQSPGFAPMTRSRIHHGLVTGESRARPAKTRCFHSSVLHRNAVVSVPQSRMAVTSGCSGGTPSRPFNLENMASVCTQGTRLCKDVVGCS